MSLGHKMFLLKFRNNYIPCLFNKDISKQLDAFEKNLKNKFLDRKTPLCSSRRV